MEITRLISPQPAGRQQTSLVLCGRELISPHGVYLQPELRLSAGSSIRARARAPQLLRPTVGALMPTSCMAAQGTTRSLTFIPQAVSALSDLPSPIPATARIRAQ